MQNLNVKGLNSQVRSGFPGDVESKNLSTKNVSMGTGCISKAPQGNERGAVGSKNPPCILEPLFFSARHGSKNPGFVLDPFPHMPCVVRLRAATVQACTPPVRAHARARTRVLVRECLPPGGRSACTCGSSCRCPAQTTPSAVPNPKHARPLYWRSPPHLCRTVLVGPRWAASVVTPRDSQTTFVLGPPGPPGAYVAPCSTPHGTA